VKIVADRNNHSDPAATRKLCFIIALRCTPPRPLRLTYRVAVEI
jgi:hypothetical protein